MKALAEHPGLAGAKRLATRLFPTADVTAVLLYGTAGAGQEEVARALAAAWLCERPTSQGSCGECAGCGAFGRGVHVDLLAVRPSGAGNQIRKHQIVRSDDAPEAVVPIRDFVATPPLMARHKVVWMSDVQRMNRDSANALLKTLEEPAPTIRFILTTSEIGRVLATIRSRCLGVACELPNDDEAIAAYGAAAPLYQFAPHAANRLQQNADAFTKLNELVEGLDTVPAGAALKLAEELKELGGQLDSDAAEREGLIATLEVFAMLVARRYPTRPDWAKRVLAAHRQVLGNVNSRTVLEAMFAGVLLSR